MAQPELSHDELQLAARNHGMPQEALRWPVTPIGLHYLLIHYDIPAIDPSSWSLEIDGEVAHGRAFSLDELRSRPVRTATVTLECAGNGRALLEPRAVSQPWLLDAVGTAEWTGTPLRGLLDDAGLNEDVREIVFTGADRGTEGGVEQDYQRALPVDEARREDILLAYEINGLPLPPQHGFPVRLLVPGWYGMTHVKWLRRITAVAEPFRGYQQESGYRLRATNEDRGRPLTRIEPRSLMVPPGIPDFMTRARLVRSGPLVLEGRAWSGWGAVERVEVSTDGGQAWGEAELDEALGPHAWRGWSFPWIATRGEHALCSRATDSTGRTQPTDPAWNVGGYANNAVQCLRVEVVDVDAQAESAE